MAHKSRPILVYLAVLAVLSEMAQAQFPLGLLPQIPIFNQQPFEFNQNVQPWEVQTLPNQVALENFDNGLNPDLEPGQWAIPDPKSWPAGPDWNDPLNTWAGINGWTSSKTTNQIQQKNENAK